MFVTTKDAEPKLIELLNNTRNEALQWRGLQFHFSHLQEHYRSPYQITIAVNLINDILKAHQGGLFVCEDSDLFLLVKNVTKAQIEKVIFQLRYLFADDPLAYNSEGEDNTEFCTLYDLSVQWEEYYTQAKRKTIRKAQKNVVREENEPVAQHLPDLKVMTPHSLVKIESEINATDLSRVMRRQPICAALPNTMVRRVFDEFYINIGHLRQMLRLDVDLLSNRWLFKYLTQVLDVRMLDMLGKQAARFLDKPVSLNVNVETLLSDRFTEFDKLIKPAMKVSIVFEIHISDVFNDMAAFLVAKEQVQKQGYRVCLDGLSALSFTQIDRERLGFDLAKLQWNADIESDLQSPDNAALAAAVKRCGANRVILCRCDNRQAVDYGQAMGISLFQGRFLDKMLDPTSKIEN
jgi:EAL domain-containing protein (putative c-di-GMP-specific phosphodiesterase class I)